MTRPLGNKTITSTWVTNTGGTSAERPAINSQSSSGRWDYNDSVTTQQSGQKVAWGFTYQAHQELYL